MTTDEAGLSSEVATVASAMVRHVLPVTSSLRLEVTVEDCGVWLHLTYRVPGAGSVWAPGSPAGELSLINSAAQRWGHYGDTHWHTLWVLV
ncbi:MAG TPA: hypothetical protein VLW50_11020 [Streptosporangiaceae bacterium]|nr:hypothetical protein [Streptosporangiaceae bacterium]